MPFCSCRPAALPQRSWPEALLRCSGQQHLPDSSLPQCRHPLRHGTLGQQLCHGALPATAPVRRPSQPASLPLRCPSQQHLPDSSSLQRPSQQHLPDGSSLQRPCRQSSVPTVPCLQQLRRSAPPSNKPHLAEKSTSVWLAICRTWAGFANSQHWDAAFATPDNICAHSSLLPR